MGIDVSAELFDVELRKRRIVRTWAGDHHVVDWCRQFIEEPLQPVEVGGIERGDARPKFETGLVQAVRVARGDDHLGSLFAGEPGRLEPDAGAPADHEYRLPDQLPV